MKRFLLLALLTTSLSGQLNWRNEDAYTLREALTADVHGSSEKFGAYSYHSGYVEGIADALNNSGFCLPEHYRNGELEEVVVKFISEHPASLHEKSSLAIGVALAEAYPCKGRKRTEGL